MANTINDYPAANSIDANADYFLVEQSAAYKKINLATMTGISGSVVGTSDSQALTNKTIGNTNTVTQKDGSFTLQNTSDTTKQGVFSLSGNTTGTTRTYTLPNASVTLASLTGTEALTNKTLTSPTITGGTIDNSTITVDSISGHTVATTVTVANLQIANGVLNTANAVTATSIAVGAIQPQALVSGTGSGWAWQSYTPTWSNLTPGNGTVSCAYSQTGKTVLVRVQMTFGSTTSVSGQINVSLPVTASGSILTTGPIGTVNFINTGVLEYPGIAELGSTTTAILYAQSASGSYVSVNTTSSTIPFTFTTGSKIGALLIYEAA